MSTKPMITVRMLLRKVVQNCIQMGEKFICKLCEFSTDSSRGLKTHIKTKHTKEVETFPIECEMCGCELENKIELKYLYLTNSSIVQCLLLLKYILFYFILTFIDKNNKIFGFILKIGLKSLLYL